MSTLNSPLWFAGGPYGLYGPGLNAANMRDRGWLDRSRVLSLDSGKGVLPPTVQLRPLHARELPGYLALEIDDYIIEFRDKRGWDVGIPESAVFVQSFEGTRVVHRAEQEWQTRSNCGRLLGIGQPGHEGLALHAGPHRKHRRFKSHRDADSHAPGPENSSLNNIGGSLGIPWVDGGGFLGGSGRQSIHVLPGDDLVDVVDHLVAFKSVENLRQGLATPSSGQLWKACPICRNATWPPQCNKYPYTRCAFAGPRT